MALGDGILCTVPCTHSSPLDSVLNVAKQDSLVSTQYSRVTVTHAGVGHRADRWGLKATYCAIRVAVDDDVLDLALLRTAQGDMLQHCRCNNRPCIPCC